MISKAQRVRIGVFTIVASALLAVVLVVFGGLHFWKRKDHYRIVFADSVMGLDSGSVVYMNGIRVGTVDSVHVLPEDIRKTLVVIGVDRGTPIRTDTKALLSFTGITGLKVIDLREGSLTAPQLEVGGLIPAGETTLDRLTRQAEAIAEQSTQLMQRANKIVDNLVAITDPRRYAVIDDVLAQADTTAHAAAATARSLASASGTVDAMVRENRTALRDSLASIRATTKSADELLTGEIAPLIENAGGIVSDLRGVVRTNSGELRSAVFDLRQASRSFKELAREVRQRPSRLLFSDAPKERKLP